MARVDEFKIPKGTTFHWGTPAKPMPEERSRAVAQLVANTAGVVEAYLPQCYAAGLIDPPAQVLVIGLARGADLAAVMASLGAGISRIFPPDEYLDILPSLDRGTLETIRESGTQIYTAALLEPGPLWKRIFSRGDARA